MISLADTTLFIVGANPNLNQRVFLQLIFLHPVNLNEYFVVVFDSNVQYLRKSHVDLLTGLLQCCPSSSQPLKY